jgi:hypothetical protein
MALLDDILSGGNWVVGLAIGAGAVVGLPLAAPILRTLAKIAIKGSILAYREATRLYDGTVRGLGDLAKEAIEEIGPDLTQKVTEEAVEEVGADLVEEAL